MLSRVAANIYWFGRYMQRAENTARLINVNAQLLMDLPPSVMFGWKPLVDIVGGTDEFTRLYDEYSDVNVMRFLMTDERYSGSILTSLTRAREILRTIRDAMPREVWERLNTLHYYVQERREQAEQDERSQRPTRK